MTPEEGVELVQLQGMPKITDSYQKLGNTKYHTKALKFTGKDAPLPASPMVSSIQNSPWTSPL